VPGRLRTQAARTVTRCCHGRLRVLSRLGAALAHESGIPQRKLADLHMFESSSAFDETERLVLRLATALTETRSESLHSCATRSSVASARPRISRSPQRSPTSTSGRVSTSRSEYDRRSLPPQRPAAFRQRRHNCRSALPSHVPAPNSSAHITRPVRRYETPARAFWRALYVTAPLWLCGQRGARWCRRYCDRVKRPSGTA